METSRCLFIRVRMALKRTFCKVFIYLTEKLICKDILLHFDNDNAKIDHQYKF